MAEIVPLTYERHGKKQLLPRTSWEFAARQHVVSLLVSEFPLAVHHLPIVFMRVDGKLTPAALLGLVPGSNAMIDAEGRWRGGYIPAVLRRHPFLLVRREPESTEYVLCLDERSDLLADSGGEPLFTDDGRPAPALEQAQKFAGEYLRQTGGGEQLCALLAEHGLLAPLVLKRAGGEELRLPGVSIVDERKLQGLADEAFLKLRASGLLPAIYAHLFSLGQLKHLLEAVPVPRPPAAANPQPPE